MLGVSVREIEVVSVHVERVTLSGKGGQKLTCCVYYVYEINSKINFLADILFLRGGLRVGYIHFPLAHTSLGGLFN
jgi:hypothetical protein